MTIESILGYLGLIWLGYMIAALMFISREGTEKEKKKKGLQPLEGGNHNMPGEDIYICRHCSEFVGVMGWRAEYCPSCGNKVDWSIVDKEKEEKLAATHQMNQEEREQFFREE